MRGEENIKKFFSDSWRAIRDILIPTATNGYKPTALRTKPLAAYAVLGIAVKVVATGMLFFFYPTPAYLSTIVASRMVALVNQSRESEQLPALQVQGALIDAAAAKGDDMFKQQYFAHDSPDGKKPWQWINRSKYNYLFAGENLAIDFSSAEIAHEAFMNSPTHRKNVLLPQYKDIGVAVLSGTMKGRETILVVNFFGAEEVKPVPKAAAAEVSASLPVAQTAPAVVTSNPVRPSPTSAQAPTPVRPAPTPVVVPAVIQPTLPALVPPVIPAAIQPEPIVPATSNTNAPAVPSEVPQPETLGAEVTNDDEPFSLINEHDEPVYQGYSSQGAIVVSTNTLTQRGVIDLIIKFMRVFFGAFLVFMAVALFLNIIVKIQVQHASVVLQSVAVIALMAALLFSQFHFAESIPRELLIL
jgi:uncharacterized protein YkwD